MDGQKNEERWALMLEGYLEAACEAETKGEYLQTGLQFRKTLFYEGKMRPEVTNAKEYVNSAWAVYNAANSLPRKD